MEKKRVAFIFFGLSRSLNKTIHLIKSNLFDPFKEHGIDHDIFIHTYKINGAYHNTWSNEHTENYINEDIEGILEPNYYIYDEQKQIENSINFEEYYTKLGCWTGMSEELTKYLIKNMCLALYSKKQITNLFSKYSENYDYAIICRPDLLIHTKFNVDWLYELNDNNIIIPIKDCFYGLNDRFCIAKPNTIIYYGTLFDQLKEYSTHTSIISEKYLKDKLEEKKIDVLLKDIYYDTLRM